MANASSADETAPYRTRPDMIRSANLPTLRGNRVRLQPRLDSPDAEAEWARRLSDPDSIIVLDLFCGAGGMSLGLEHAGMFVAAGVDSDPECCATHSANLLSNTVRRDITKIVDPRALIAELGIPRVHVIAGGPPCQGFSLAGRAKIRSLPTDQREEIHKRNFLYREFIRFVDGLKPTFFVLENVPHMGTFADGIIADEIKQDFKKLGYSVYHTLMDAADYGVPQTRRRLFFVGSSIGWVYQLPGRTHGARLPRRTLADAIWDLPVVEAPSLEEEKEYRPADRPHLEVSGEYAERMRLAMPRGQHDRLFDHIVRPVRDDDAVIFAAMDQGHCYKDVDPRYRRYELKRSNRDNHRFDFVDRYQRLKWDRPCSTITAHIAKDGYRYIHPDQIRTLSVREAARIQSFPDRFRFSGHRTNRFRQIGNAVPPLLAEAIGRSIVKAIRAYRAGEASEEWQPSLPGLIDNDRVERQQVLPGIGGASAHVSSRSGK